MKPVALLLAASCAASGCALAMKQAPNEDRAPGEAPVCSTGRGGVALDALMATLLGVGMVAALANDEAGAGLAFGAVGGVFTASAVSGHTSANKCEAAIEQYQSELVARAELAQEEAAQPRALASRPQAGPPAPRPPPVRPVESEDVDEPASAAAVPAAEETEKAPPRPATARQAPAPAPAPAPGGTHWSDFWIEIR